MNKKLTEIAFVLDRSGSMTRVARAAINGYNDFLREQQSAPGQARLTLALFDDEYLLSADHLPIQEVLPLNSDTYVPRNSTALLDAIGETIERVGTRLQQTAEKDRPGKVIVAILTDGHENASVKYSWKDIAQKIRHQTDVYHWEFLFLGANQDAIATAANLSIAASNAATFASDSIGASSVSRSVSRKTSALRAAASGMPMTPAEKKDVEFCMGDIVKEEDRKERGGE